MMIGYTLEHMALFFKQQRLYLFKWCLFSCSDTIFGSGKHFSCCTEVYNYCFNRVATMPAGSVLSWSHTCYCRLILGTTARRHYSISRVFPHNSERARLVTSFYYQSAIDQAAMKV